MLFVDLDGDFFGPKAQGRVFTDLAKAHFENSFEVAIDLDLLELGG